MTTVLLFFTTLAAILMTSSATSSGRVDMTLQEGAKGTDLVNAVVDRIKANCIFSSDRLFLRRMAFVVSSDGMDLSTYRAGYHGGIWQVNETVFNETKTSTSNYVSNARLRIKDELQIDWSTVTWSDLRKPLYSGLAATLSVIQRLGSSTMPGDVKLQYQLFHVLYAGISNTTFITKAEEATAFECTDRMDLVFILDSSGSVSFSDFSLMLNFTASITEVMNVTSDVVRVADIVYSTDVQVEFDFDDYTTEADLRNRIMDTTKLNDYTYTNLGLDMAAAILYDASRGARQGAKKVAVLITDGRSNSYSETVASAHNLKNLSTTIFTIGVGQYNPHEINVVASEPTCSHVFTLPGFSFIKSILKEIQKSTCEASFVLTMVSAVEGEISSAGSETRTVTSVPGNDHIVEANVTCGVLNIFVSTSDPHPNSAVHDAQYTVLPGQSVTLTIASSLPAGTILYITVVGQQASAVEWEQNGCTVSIWTMAIVPKPPAVQVVCIDSGVQRNCTQQDIVDAGFCSEVEVPEDNIENPCTIENLDAGLDRFLHPYDSTKFLQCDVAGNMYVTSCPDGLPFNSDTLQCGYSAPGGAGTGNSAQPLGSNNPCTPQALANLQFYHTYVPDETKFIQCDQWGRAWVMPCAAGSMWSQPDLTCIHLPTILPPASTIPPIICSAPGDYLADPCDHTVFYQCGASNQPLLQQCPAGLYFDPITNVCTATDLQAPSPAYCSG